MSDPTAPISNVGDLIARLTSGKIRRVRITPKFWRAAWHTTQMALDLFGEDNEEKAKDFVRTHLQGLAARTDIPGLPDWLETPLEELAINMLVDSTWPAVLEVRAALGRGSAAGSRG